MPCWPWTASGWRVETTSFSAGRRSSSSTPGRIYGRRRDSTAGRVLRARPVGHRRDDAVARRRSDLILLSSSAIELMSIAVYVLTGYDREEPAVRRSRAQVLPGRGLRERLHALRDRAAVRRDGHDSPIGGRTADRHGRGERRRSSSDRRRPGCSDRLRLQGGRGSVPHVDAGRVRGRADPGDRPTWRPG